MDDDDIELPRKSGLKLPSRKPIQRNPSQDEFESQVKEKEKHIATTKEKAATLAIKFKTAMQNTELFANKSVLQKDMEKQLISDMVTLASEIDNDPAERECIGTLSWVTMLLKTCFSQRDRMNELDYRLSRLEK